MSDEVESVIRMPTRNRGCEACGESPLQEVYHWSHIAATRSKRWLFENRIVICKNCGFSFLSPCHEADALSSYYSDSFARFGGQALDFSPEKRLAFIEKAMSHRGGLKVEGVIELGGNAATSFQEGLKAAYGEVAAYEPNAECCSDFNDAGQVPSSAFDLLVHYFILEHIPDVRAFLRQCHRMLRTGGVMVLEVPDLRLYPSMIDALILHEHCNHFTPENLRHLAALEGFKMIEVSHEMCSRPFGFVAAFERLKDSQIEPFRADAFERNLAALEGGVQRVLAFRACIQTTLESCDSILSSKWSFGVPMTIWSRCCPLVKLCQMQC